MTGAAELFGALRVLDTLPHGPEALTQARQAERLAERLGDPELLYRSRRALLIEAFRAGDGERTFVALAWCLGMHDSDPVRYPSVLVGPGAAATGDILRAQHDAILRVTGLPAIRRRTLARLIDDFEARARAQGHGPYAPAKLRLAAAWSLEPRDRLRPSLDAWLATEPDELAACAVCDRAIAGQALVRIGDHEAALVTLAPLLDGELACDDQPRGMRARVLRALLATRRLELARRFHVLGVREVDGDPTFLSELGEHVDFLRLTGNTGHAVELVRRNLHLLQSQTEPGRRLDFLGPAARALTEHVANGHGADLAVVQWRDPASRPVPARQLAHELLDAAVDLAAVFDVRNGHTEASTALRDPTVDAALRVELPIERT